MRSVECEGCGESFPQGETLRILNHVFCAKCSEAEFAKHDELPEGSVAPNVDPTVCVFCNKDGGETEFELLAGAPACQACIELCRNRPFPTWLKAAAATLALFVVGSLAWNWRFTAAYLDLRRMSVALEAGDLAAAAEFAEALASRIPESTDWRAVADYHSGLVCLQQDRSHEAVAKLSACQGRVPPDWQVDYYLLYARHGAAFYDADYEGMLAAAREIVETGPSDYMAIGSLASALACQYAATGDEAFRAEALETMKEAASLDDERFDEFQMRINHRLQTREVLSREEFIQRFPDGWTSPEEDGA